MTCPGNFTFARYLASPMRELERATIEDHLVGCSECRGKLANYVKNRRTQPPTRSRPDGEAIDRGYSARKDRP